MATFLEDGQRATRKDRFYRALDLTGAACLVFQHGSSGRVNIIYRRTDGNVGWVDPPAVSP